MAEDLWEDVMHEASFGGVRLDVLSARSTAGRALARHVYPRRNGAQLEDAGAEPRVDHCRLIFFQRSAADNHLERLAMFHEAFVDGGAHTLVHPLLGSYQAKISTFDLQADAEPRDVVMVDVVFEEHADEPAIFDIGAGSPALSGLEEVSASAAAMDAALDDVAAATGDDVWTSVGTRAVTAATAWEAADPEDPTTFRDINLEMVSLTNDIDREIDRLELATSVERYPIWVTMVGLRATLRKAVEALAERSPRIIEITVTAPTPLLVIAARTYGGDEAEWRCDQLRRLNDIRNPNRVETGTVLKAQAPSAPRARLRAPGA